MSKHPLARRTDACKVSDAHSDRVLDTARRAPANAFYIVMAGAVACARTVIEEEVELLELVAVRRGPIADPIGDHGELFDGATRAYAQGHGDVPWLVLVGDRRGCR